MRVWIDVSNSPHVAFFRPLIALLWRRGHVVQVTTRDYAQTLQLLRLHGIPHEVVGPGHGGASAAGKSGAMASRVLALRRFAGRREFDLALSHASHELPLVARSLGIPSAYAFDYEFAQMQHRIGCTAARRVVVPDAIPQDRLERLGARAAKIRRYPGLKEEYYLHGFEPNVTVLEELGLDRTRVVVVLRTPPDVSLYYRGQSALFARVLDRLGRDEAVQVVVLPRTAEQRDAIRSRGLASLVVPERVIDAMSLVALADLLVSAGGTMNREAVALGVPAYTTFEGDLGAVDEMLVRDGRLRRLTNPDELVLAKHKRRAVPPTRDPALLLDLMASALER